MNCNVSVKTGLQMILQNFLLIAEKWIYLQNYSKIFWPFFTITFAGLIYIFANSDQGCSETDVLTDYLFTLLLPSCLVLLSVFCSVSSSTDVHN